MPAADVRCQCGLALGRVEGASAADLAAQLESLLVAAHASDDHCTHPMEVVLDCPGRRPQRLVIECLFENCRGTRRQEHEAVEPELVGSFTIAFHTAHEGHALEVTYGDRSWASPPGPAGRRKPT